MRRIAVFFLMIAFCGVCFADDLALPTPDPTSTPSTEPTQPKLTIVDPDFDFGVVQEGDQVHHDFVFRNDGTAPLELQRFVSACGCTTVQSDPDKAFLKPDESLTATVTLDTKGFSGIKTKTVRLFTNDPIVASGVMSLHGEIRPEFSIDPPRAYFGDVMHGESRSIEVLLKSNLPATKFGEISTRSEYVALTKTDTPEGTKVQVQLKPDAPIGILRSTVTLQTTSVNEPVVAFPVFAKIQGDLQLLPTYASFDLLDGPLESAISKTVELKNIADDAPKLISVESNNPAVSGSVREIEPGKLFEITVTIHEGAIGVVRAQLTVMTDRSDQDRRSVVLPVYAVIAKKGE